MDAQCSTSDLTRLLENLYGLVHPYFPPDSLHLDEDLSPILAHVYMEIEAVSDVLLIRGRCSRFPVEIRVPAEIRTSGFITLDYERLSTLLSAVQAAPSKQTTFRADYLPPLAPWPGFENLEPSEVPRSTRDVELRRTFSEEMSAAAGDPSRILAAESQFQRAWSREVDSRLAVRSGEMESFLPTNTRREPNPFSGYVSDSDQGPTWEGRMTGATFRRLVGETDLGTGPSMEFRFLEVEESSAAMAATNGQLLLRSTAHVESECRLASCPMLDAKDLRAISEHFDEEEIVCLRASDFAAEVVVSSRSLAARFLRCEYMGIEFIAPELARLARGPVETRRVRPGTVLAGQVVEADSFAVQLEQLIEAAGVTPVLLGLHGSVDVRPAIGQRVKLELDSREAVFDARLIIQVLNWCTGSAVLVQDCLSPKTDKGMLRVLAIQPFAGEDSWHAVVMPFRWTVGDATSDPSDRRTVSH
jgi:hypothetical protein